MVPFIIVVDVHEFEQASIVVIELRAPEKKFDDDKLIRFTEKFRYVVK